MFHSKQPEEAKKMIQEKEAREQKKVQEKTTIIKLAESRKKVWNLKKNWASTIYPL